MDGEGSALRARSEALQGWTLVGTGVDHEEAVGWNAVIRFGIGRCAFEHGSNVSG